MSQVSQTIAPAYLAEFDSVAKQLCRTARVDVDEEVSRRAQWFRELCVLYKEGIAQGCSSEQAFEDAKRAFSTPDSLAAQYRDPWLVRLLLHQRTRMTCLVVVVLQLVFGGLAFTLLPSSMRPYSFFSQNEISSTTHLSFWPILIPIYLALMYYRRRLYRRGDTIQFWVITVIAALQLWMLAAMLLVVLRFGKFVFLSWHVLGWILQNGAFPDIASAFLVTLSTVVACSGIVITPLFILCGCSLFFDVAHYKEALLPAVFRFLEHPKLFVNRLLLRVFTVECRKSGRAQN